jgi:hypothetical protein
MANREYYTSERFIWDRLKRDAERGLSGIYKTWKLSGKIEPFLISWPAEVILDDKGLPTDAPCLRNLPSDESLWTSAIVTFAQKTKSYALLVAEQLDDKREVRVTLESHHGTRSWTLPILISGDIRTLGDAVVQDDVHKIGVLWNRPAFA